MPSDNAFDHLVLTRFSVRIGAATTFDDEWLAYRWGFFRDGLMASLRTQTECRFTWLVFFDASTPEWLRELINETSTALFTPVFLDSDWNQQPVRHAVASVSSSPYLITTRIDSDDAVARSFVEVVQAQFASQDSLYVNLMCGVQIDRSLRPFAVSFAENAFISFIERRIPGEEPRTVFQCLAHEESSSFAPVLNIVGPPMWMQVIHGSNVANSVRGLRTRPEPIAAAFDVDHPLNTRVSAVRFAREWCVSVARLIRVWLTHPTFAITYGRNRALHRRGTTTVPVHVHRERRSITAMRSVWRGLHGRPNS